MKKRLIALMLLLTMLMAGCVARANEAEIQSQKQATAAPMEVVEEVTSNAFTDVPEDSFYFNAVNWAVGKGITNGLTDTTFGPDAECNRAQVVTFLWRLAGKPAASGESSFTDVPAGEWYTDAVLWAVEKGITNGLNATTFGPDEKCNRAQIVTFLWRYAGMPDADAENPFGDVPANEWYANAVLWAVEKGITNGLTDTTFGPNEKCNRAQIVTFLYRYAESMDEEPVDPQPTDPQPTEPTPTEPQPTEPQPTEPQPTEPQPTEPQPTEPQPTEPQPTEPQPTEPQPTEPKPTEPQPTEPPVTEPPVTEPPETEPLPTEDPNMGEWA